MVAGGKDEERDSQGVWVEHVHTALFKMNNRQVPIAWTPVQCYVADWMGGEFSGENVYVWASSFTPHLELSKHLWIPQC